MDFTINQESHHRADPVRVGELQVWDVINQTPVDHPFHLHGFFFQVLEVNGTPPEFLSWEDTVNIPARVRVRIAWMPDDRVRFYLRAPRLLSPLFFLDSPARVLPEIRASLPSFAARIRPRCTMRSA